MGWDPAFQRRDVAEGLTADLFGLEADLNPDVATNCPSRQYAYRNSAVAVSQPILRRGDAGAGAGYGPDRSIPTFSKVGEVAVGREPCRIRQETLCVLSLDPGGTALERNSKPIPVTLIHNRGLDLVAALFGW